MTAPYSLVPALSIDLGKDTTAGYVCNDHTRSLPRCVFRIVERPSKNWSRRVVSGALNATRERLFEPGCDIAREGKVRDPLTPFHISPASLIHVYRIEQFVVAVYRYRAASS